jgi:hypothetical protein
MEMERAKTMDAKVLESFTALLNQALTTQLLLTAFVSLLAAGFGSYFGGYLTKKAERRVAKEAFGEVLKEQIETTFETERVKTAIGSAASESLEKLRTDLQKRLASVTFWRERIAKMKDTMFEGAVALDTLRFNCSNVFWLGRTSVEDIHERGHVAIARIVYAQAELQGMGAAGQEKANFVSMLSWRFQNFVGYVALYKEQIAEGNITFSSGATNDTAKRVEDRLVEAANEWRKVLDELRTLIVSLSIAPELLSK